MKRLSIHSGIPCSPEWGGGGSTYGGAAPPSANALAQALAGIAGDLVLVLDEQGHLLAAAGTGATADGHPGASWLPTWMQARTGQAWADLVLPESRHKVTAMLAELHRGEPVRHREIGHGTHDGHAVLMTCCAARLGEHGPWLVVGRDGSAEAARMQRLTQALHELEARYQAAFARLEGDARETRSPGGTLN